MKKKTSVLLSLLIAISVSAQEVVSTQGDSYSQASANIDFTIGEVIIETGTDGIYDLTQGFHQSSWVFVGIEDFDDRYEVTIFPNPTSDILNINASEFMNVTYAMYDALGKLVMQDKLSAEQTPIPVRNLAPGGYSIILLNEAQKLKTFKLVKTN